MSEAIRAYLESLRRELAGSDPATIQDALADAEDHLRADMERARASGTNRTDEELLAEATERFGTPVEVAAAYREIEKRVAPGITGVTETPGAGLFDQVFGVVRDPRAYAALLYMVLSLPLGTAYFTWTVTGLSLSLSLMVLIIGLPFFGLFLLSIQGLGVVEGRVVEGLLGVRMPKRTVFSKRHLGWWGQLKAWIVDGRTWTTVVYFLLMMVLGTLYFSIFITLIAISLGLVATPFVEMIVRFGGLDAQTVGTWLPGWLLWIAIPAGLFDLIVTLHLARLIGRWHGRMAKTMLVRG
ncbi:MAG: sensor domain-containing protein [Candidatus Eisenbacteria bacterium]